MSLFYSSFYRILNSDRSKIEPTLCTKEDSFNVKANIDQNVIYVMLIFYSKFYILGHSIQYSRKRQNVFIE